MRTALFFGLLGAAIVARADETVREDNRELHVVGIEKGAERTDNDVHGGRAVVTVNRPGKQITLVLAGRTGITWEVKTVTGTVVDCVILGGYDRQAVKGLTEPTKIVNAFRQKGQNGAVGFARIVESLEFRTLAHQLGKLTELEIASFHGTPEYRHESPIVIDQMDDDPRFLRSYPQSMPRSELPEITFPAIYHSPDAKALPAYGEFTLAGPKMETLKSLPSKVMRLVHDPIGKKFYGLARGLVEVDLEAQAVTEIETGKDVPPIELARDLTWDADRGRILIAGRHLHAFVPATRTWSVLIEDPQVTALTYYAPHNRVYGIALHAGDDRPNIPYLHEFNAHGALIRVSPLDAPMLPYFFSQGVSSAGIQLVVVGDDLALLEAQDANGALPKTTYLIDPKTGKARLAWKESTE